MSQALATRMRALSDTELARKERAWQANANAGQREAALYQQWADAARKELKRRGRNGG